MAIIKIKNTKNVKIKWLRLCEPFLTIFFIASLIKLGEELGFPEM
tara:strand:+ start:321 stop:455 length:135 start_codon:yes stop_codon:yes gene_type:complete